MIVRLRFVAPVELAPFFAGWPVARSGALLFAGPVAWPEEHLAEALELGVRANVAWLTRHPSSPRAIDVARYEREPEGENDWLTLPLVLGLHWAEYAAATGHPPRIDCEDLSMADAAEERARGNPRARALPIIVSPTMRHIVTDTGAGQRDVSRLLIDSGRGIPWNR